jgi:integrase
MLLQVGPIVIPYFDFADALRRSGRSAHTQRAYLRWAQRYLVDQGVLSRSRGVDRAEQLARVPVERMLPAMTAPALARWLRVLVAAGQGRQSVDQARAAIVFLAEQAAAGGLLAAEVPSAMHAVPTPAPLLPGSSGRRLSQGELQRLIAAARDMTPNEAQAVRNTLLMTMLCGMALRREELADARWGDISGATPACLHIADGAGQKVEVALPRSITPVLARWEGLVAATPGGLSGQSPLLRRIWKGGRISRAGLSPEGIWHVVRLASEASGLGHVSPEDLRRSVAAGLHEEGFPVEAIQRTLRHRSRDVTERYLRRILREGD